VPVRGGAGRAVLGHQIDIEADRRLPLRRGQLRLPVHVEPAAAEGVHERADIGHVLAPARLAAQADAIDTARGIVELRRIIGDLVIGRLVRHLQAGLLEQVLAIECEGALGIEGHGVELAVRRQAVLHGLEDVGVVVVVAEVVDAREPAGLAPDRRLVGADGDDVELPALGGDVGGHALAEHVLLQHDPIEFVAGRLFPLRRQLLHDDHVGIVDRGDGQRFRGCQAGTSQQHGGRQSQPTQRPH